jgi:hypothetical protein
MNSVRTLRIAAGVEAVSLGLLLGNLLLAHTKAITTLGGPIHGTAYLVVIAATWLVPTATGSGARWCAVIPGLGGLLALQRIKTRTIPPVSASSHG